MFTTKLETSRDDQGLRLMAPLVFEGKNATVRVPSGTRTAHSMTDDYAPAKVLKETHPHMYREALKSLGAPFWVL